MKSGQTVKIGYFAQDSSEMDETLRVIDYIKEEAHVIKTRGRGYGQRFANAGTLFISAWRAVDADSEIIGRGKTPAASAQDIDGGSLMFYCWMNLQMIWIFRRWQSWKIIWTILPER